MIDMHMVEVDQYQGSQCKGLVVKGIIAELIRSH